MQIKKYVTLLTCPYFIFSAGRDSVDLLEAPIQAPRNLSGLMKYLNHRQQSQRGYGRQPSNVGRELPNIPEVDTTEPIFLASDGTKQPVAEPISPTLHSEPSFDVPDPTAVESCELAIEKPADEVPSAPDTTDQTLPSPSATSEVATPPTTSEMQQVPAELPTVNQTTPHIVIDFSHEPGSNHGTPESSLS